jgi:hypothetical protein
VWISQFMQRLLLAALRLSRWLSLMPHEWGRFTTPQDFFEGT